jgi:hypothetical protein
VDLSRLSRRNMDRGCVALNLANQGHLVGSSGHVGGPFGAFKT